MEERGFTRVPDVEYQNERKMVCGVVLEINGYKYYVPVSSYKKKQPNNLLIQLDDDRFNQVKGSLHFNFMFLRKISFLDYENLYIYSKL